MEELRNDVFRSTYVLVETLWKDTGRLALAKVEFARVPVPRQTKPVKFSIFDLSTSSVPAGASSMPAPLQLLRLRFPVIVTGDEKLPLQFKWPSTLME
jgi:hypothetical protein